MKFEFRSLFKNFFGSDVSDNLAPKTTTTLRYLNDSSNVFSNRADYTRDILIKTCVDTISKHFSKLQANHIKQVNNNVIQIKGNIDEILNLKPNMLMTAYNFYYKLISSALQTGNGYAYVKREKNVVKEIIPLDYQSVEAKEANGELYLTFTFRQGKKQTIPYADIIHLRFRFLNGEFLSDINDNLFDNLRLVDILQQTFENSAVNSGRIKGVAQITGQAGTDLWKNKANILNENLKESGGLVVTDSTMTFTPYNGEPTPADTSQLEYVRNNIYHYYGLSEAIVNNTYTESDWQSFFESTIEPLLIQLSQEMTIKILTPAQRKRGEKIYLDANRLTYASTATKVELIKQLRPLGLLTANQSLELINLPPVENGENRVQTLNLADVNIINDYQLLKVTNNQVTSTNIKDSGGDKDE